MSEKFDEAVDAAYAAINYSIPHEMVEDALRAALAVLREPSDSMTLAGDNVYEVSRDDMLGPAPVPMWRAMIDEALKP